MSTIQADEVVPLSPEDRSLRNKTVLFNGLIFFLSLIMVAVCIGTAIVSAKNCGMYAKSTCAKVATVNEIVITNPVYMPANSTHEVVSFLASPNDKSNGTASATCFCQQTFGNFSMPISYAQSIQPPQNATRYCDPAAALCPLGQCYGFAYIKCTLDICG
eukprot:TRINITY_DN200_c0_g1_i2.p1 TRINITY_DN200_c0_g1~~TRINITY_DN200_c0_g1_i2.p1  ORF type:complete len:160 (-),score=11.07 TRINITY_DN200_c0_g1_i2:18-497(-)